MDMEVTHHLFLGAEVSEFVERHFIEELEGNTNYKSMKYELALK